jgi:hypothetical protein
LANFAAQAPFLPFGARRGQDLVLHKTQHGPCLGFLGARLLLTRLGSDSLAGLSLAGQFGEVLLGVDGDQAGGQASRRRGQDGHRRRHQRPMPAHPLARPR